MFVGVAGSLKPKSVLLGDVVVATTVYGYHGGKAADEFLVRPTAFPAAHRLEQLAREIRREQTWFTRLVLEAGAREPKVHLKPIAAGEVVIDSADSELYKFLVRNYNDAVAVEMEGAGVFYAAHANDSLPALVIRGISDLATNKENTDREGWQGTASERAALFAIEVLSRLDPNDLPGLRGPGSSRQDPVGWVSVRDFSRRTLEVTRAVAREGRPVVVTHRGVPLVLVSPIEQEQLALLMTARAEDLEASLEAADSQLKLGDVIVVPGNWEGPPASTRVAPLNWRPPTEDQ
jgi:prevent-host-death family protein